MKLDRAVHWAAAVLMGVGLVSVLSAPRSGDENAAPVAAERIQQAWVQQAEAIDGSTTRRYVGRRWVEGPYYGLCDDSCYECPGYGW